jgi:23S rRNA pseudouridine955/2504/2580 synthase
MRLDPARLRSITLVDEADDWLAVAKPPGLAVHGGAGESGPTLLAILAEAYAAPLELHPVHRLDKPTSGVVLVAKSASAARALQAAWPSAKKRYHAIALGRVAGPLELSAPLADEDGVRRPARTRARPLAYLGGLEPKTTWLEVELETGRFHQIRRHLAGEKRPVLLDDRYGDFAANKAFSKAAKDAGVRGVGKSDLLLHAHTLELTIDGAARRFVAPLPARWRALLAAAGAPPGEVEKFTG